MFRFSELSAVPIDASDSKVSSSDARGSRDSISYVSSSLQREKHVRFSNISHLNVYRFLLTAHSLLFLQILDLFSQHSFFLLHGDMLLRHLGVSDGVLVSALLHDLWGEGRARTHRRRRWGISELTWSPLTLTSTQNSLVRCLGCIWSPELFYMSSSSKCRPVKLQFQIYCFCTSLSMKNRSALLMNHRGYCNTIKPFIYAALYVVPVKPG